eukprot:CAMPEP_0172599744 /NCGR_PEP_ID=MMETSP1068-20121228/19860_1 /TAXON_ID=35684 /ORGANISM="Pseudopedinella elastica, Strain CCMP716" /LENGTH=225 /DNA_ID=CAMNT_0013400099 /DNA_START=95 /DNA_END=772 /DNA_ORIENTATION=+
MAIPAALTVAVGSKNPCKVKAVRLAFSDAFPTCQLKISPFDVASGVSDQPMSEEETKQGAENRAKAAAAAFAQAGESGPDFAVGLEGGVGRCGEGLDCFAYMAVLAPSRPLGLANPSTSRTASFLLPPVITRLMDKEGLELGDADDKIFSRVNSKHRDGTVGILTKGVIGRSVFYRHALAFALVPFLPGNAWLYDTTGTLGPEPETATAPEAAIAPGGQPEAAEH